MTRGASLFLALLRIAAGVVLLWAGIHKIGWMSHPMLEQTLASWTGHSPNALVTSYLHTVTPHHLILARVVLAGEIGLGLLLILGLLTPLASLLAFLMVLNFHFASGAMFHADYWTGPSGLVFVLVFLVLMAGRAGLLLGLDGMISGAGRKGPGRAA